VFGCTILGSGSKGNASVIHGPEGNLLLDAGFSAKELMRRLKRVGVDPCSLRAILITHDHSDHTDACRIVSDRLGIPAYFIPETYCELSKCANKVPKRKILITPGSPLDLCGIHVEPFSVSHDTPAIAFTFTFGACKIGFATDLGFISNLAKARLSGCDLLVLESNYDPARLRASNRPLKVVRRIAGKQGHLGNPDAMEALGTLLSPNTRNLVFAHLSQECNDPALVAELAESRLAELRRQDVSFRIASQSEPLETFWLE
jgi:phosphoribosyl 1,2-cyclic phosphodiesterase